MKTLYPVCVPVDEATNVTTPDAPKPVAARVGLRGINGAGPVIVAQGIRSGVLTIIGDVAGVHRAIDFIVAEGVVWTEQAPTIHVSANNGGLAGIDGACDPVTALGIGLDKCAVIVWMAEVHQMRN